MKYYKRVIELNIQEYGMLQRWLKDSGLSLFEEGKKLIEKIENADLVISDKKTSRNFNYINETKEEKPDIEKPDIESKNSDIELEDLKEGEAIAYSDGSYNSKTSTYGYGVVLQVDGKQFEYKGSDDNPKKAKLANIAGEIDGARRAVEEAVKHGCKSLTLYFDYTGIEFWVTGVWQAKNEWTQEYAKWMRKQPIKINFVHVKGHTGNKGNERCDKLAKEAVGLI